MKAFLFVVNGGLFSVPVANVIGLKLKISSLFSAIAGILVSRVRPNSS